MVALPVPIFMFFGYSIDVLAILRIVLGLSALNYFRRFGERPDAALYQCRHRQLIFAFFSLEAFADLLLHAFGTGTTIVLMKEMGSLGIAFAMFLTSQKIIKSASMAVLPIPILVIGIVQFIGMDIDVLSLISIALVLLSAHYYPRATRVLKLNPRLNFGRKFFILTILASYVFRFIGVLLGADLLLFEELSETLAVSVALYGIRESVEKNEV